MESDDEDVLYDGRTLIGEKRYKNVNDVMNGSHKDKRKLRKTLALCLAFVSLGLCIAILGPTLLSLKGSLRTTLPKISLIFTGRSFGYLVGAVVGGFLFDHFNPLLLIGASLLFCGAGITTAPYLPSLLTLGIAIATAGVCMGFLDTGANLVCLRMWGKKRSPAMLQALHFSFALGAFIAPLLAAPFLPANVSALNKQNNASFASSLANPTLFPTVTPTAFNGTTTVAKAEDVGEGGPQRKLLSFSGNEISSRDERGAESENNKTENSDSTEPKTPLPTQTTPTPTTPTPNNTTPTNIKPTTPTPTTPTPTTPTTTTPTPTTPTPTTPTPTTPTPTTPTPNNTTPTNTTPTTPTPTTPTTTTPTPTTNTSIKKTAGDGANDPSNQGKDNPNLFNDTNPSEPQSQVKQFQLAYVIIGILVLFTSLVFLYFFCSQPKNEPRYTGKEQPQETVAVNKCTFRNRILVLLFFFYFLYVGGEVAFGGFISAYAVQSKLAFAPDRASHVAALFWGTFALGRGLAICLANLVSPLKMLLADLIGCLGTSLLLTLFVEDNAQVLWIGSAFLGLFMASLFPSGIAWLQEYTTVTGNAASILIVGSSLGEMVIPLIISYLFSLDDPGPIVLMYVMLAISALSTLIFFYVIWLAAETGEEKESLPAEENLALELIKTVEEALPLEDISFQNGSSAKQMKKQLIPQNFKRKNHRE